MDHFGPYPGTEEIVLLEPGIFAQLKSMSKHLLQNRVCSCVCKRIRISTAFSKIAGKHLSWQMLAIRRLGT